MTIKQEGEFFVDMNLAGGLSIGIESDNILACIEEVKKRNAIGVFGHPGFGFKQDNMDFFVDIPHIESIWFWDVKLKDVNGIYELQNLKEFGVYPKRPGINFSRLATIEQLVWEYNKKDSGIDTLYKLKLFHIWHYNPKEKDFSNIAVPKFIEDLQITWCNPSDLKGFPIMENLKKLVIARCRNLKTLAELPRIAPNLEHLVVESSGKVSDGEEVVKKLPCLKHAFVRGKVLIKNK